MPSAFYQPQGDAQRVSARRRAFALALAIAAHILVVLLLLRLTPSPSMPPSEAPALTAFDVAPSPKAAPTPAPKGTVAEKKSGSPPPPRAPRAVAPAEKPPAPITLPNTHEFFEAADISKLPSQSADAQGTKGDSEGTEVGSTYGPGEGPGGERLYNAEWFREPTRAELAFYVPAKFRTGVALIACKTAARNRVENCRSLGETPPGSGIARGMREAAWQFQVRPPRVGGRPLIGAWVRIRLEFTETGVKP